MRIICDQCDQPISGTVERFSGNFNLHPECLTQFAGELQASNPSKLPVQELSMSALVNWKQRARITSQALNGS